MLTNSMMRFSAVSVLATLVGCQLVAGVRTDVELVPAGSGGVAGGGGMVEAGGMAGAAGMGGKGGAGGAGGMAGTGGMAGGAGGMGGAGGGPSYCTTTLVGAARGSAIAITPDENHIVSVNRDNGSVSTFSVDYTDGQPKLTKVAELDLGAGSEPWQVAIDGCGKRAYVVLRKDQKVVAIEDIDTAMPKVGPNVNVGSEPTAIALTPNNTKIYVTNWVDGTLSVIDAGTLTPLPPVDLNAVLVGTGLLGTITARPALAHPRSLTITNDADDDDTDENVYVTEWFAQRTEPETVATADTNKKGLVYKVSTYDSGVSTIDLPAIMDTGFPDHNGAVTGCFPNQVGAISIDNGYAYVTSTCASPKGPIGVFAPTGACTVGNQAAVCGMVGGICNSMTLTCDPNNTDVKTTTHPALTIIDLANDMVTETVTLDKRFSDIGSTRMPLLPTDLAFFNGFGYLSSLGSDAVYRLVFANGTIMSVGSMVNKFIDLRRPTMDTLLRTPVGIVTARTKAFGFVNNGGSYDVTALSFNIQGISGDGAVDFRITQSSDLPAAGSPADTVLRGKRFFNTGLGRWSLNGEAWGSCAACHIDGLSDNVTWYFARGPRQSTSLDGSFASADPTDQRIFNWTAIFDEVADFENNTRGVSGGKGAIVDATDNRINIAAEMPPQQGLQGSTNDAADPAGVSGHPHGVLNDWKEIEAYIRSIRSPKKPSNLVAADVTAGKALFAAGQGNCIACHSGAKWTISKRFYTPGDGPNAATADMAMTSLSNKTWNVALNGFPAALQPIGGTAIPANDARMRFGAAPSAEQIQCILRPVGTFSASPAAVGILEVRADMTTVAQGNADTGRGYNPPSLLGLQVGAPYYHAGNARTLEEVFDAMFAAHHQSAVANVFVLDAIKRRQLVAYLLSIDESEPTIAVPVKGASGGDICFYP